MRFNLTMVTHAAAPALTLNYQYPLSSAIYKIIQKADAEFAAFLHNTGYGNGYKSFKFFTFSDLRTPFRILGDRMQMLTDTAEVTICFHMPEAAENFIKGLFIQQQLDIADSRSKVSFQVKQVESLPVFSGASYTGNAIVELQPLSPLVTGQKNERGHYDYRSPLDSDFTDCLLYNWLEKYAAAYNVSEEGLHQVKREVSITVQPFAQPPKQRLIAIKQGTAAETRVRGYKNFGLQVTAPLKMVELALNSGLGILNSQGMGCVGIINDEWAAEAAHSNRK